MEFKKHKNLQIKKYIQDVFGPSLSINSIGIAISRQNKILRSNVFEFDEKKVRKVSDTVIHLIKRLNEESNGFITGGQLKSKIKRYLDLDISVSSCLFYMHKIIGTNFEEVDFSLKSIMIMRKLID